MFYCYCVCVILYMFTHVSVYLYMEARCSPNLSCLTVIRTFKHFTVAYKVLQISLLKGGISAPVTVFQLSNRSHFLD